jgi:hypothetical protein
MPNTAHLTDRLDDIIDSTWNDVVDLLKDYFVTHGGDLPCLHNDLDYGGEVASLIDSAVPIYNAELSELAYFHHDAALSALVDMFGSADGDWPNGAFAAGLYCLIEQGVGEKWDEEAEDLWQEWLDELDTATIRKAALGQWTAQQSSIDTEPPTTPEA